MLSLQHATKKYVHENETRGVSDISFSIKQGEIVCILGRSGSGKSTLLRILAGLESLDNGTLTKNEADLTSYVSQEYTLWPHLTVLENLTLASKLKNPLSEELITIDAKKLLERFGLDTYAHNYPNNLSGGQRQRVALLRAIMVKPKILLLDEITSALDPELTKSVLDLIRALAKDGYTMILVTHHMSFAMSVADRILFLKNGNLIRDQIATEFFTDQSDADIKSFVADIAKKDESVEVFRGTEQFQAYHLGLTKRLKEKSIIHVAGAVGDAWYTPMGEFYNAYEKMRIQKQIVWKMITYSQGEKDMQLMRDYPELNQFCKMPRTIQNPANYNVFEDTVITQIFGDEPIIIQIKNQHVAHAYMRFFEEMWESSTNSK